MTYCCGFAPSSDAASIGQSIKRRRITAVWHLTYLSQLSDIFRVGALLSRAEMDSLGISYGRSGWGNEQKASDFKDYICGSIIWPWGMSKEQPETKALISLDTKVLLRNGVLFCGRWSSFNAVATSDLVKNCTVGAFDLMFDNPTSGFPAPAPGEFLVPRCVALAEFSPVIYVYHESAKQQILDSCGNMKLPSGSTVAESFKIAASGLAFRGSVFC